MLTKEPVVITLSAPEALVLFEFLTRSDERERFEILDFAERLALWSLEAALEKILVEPFSPRYTELLEEARRLLREVGGEKSY